MVRDVLEHDAERSCDRRLVQIIEPSSYEPPQTKGCAGVTV